MRICFVENKIYGPNLFSFFQNILAIIYIAYRRYSINVFLYCFRKNIELKNNSNRKTYFFPKFLFLTVSETFLTEKQSNVFKHDVK